MDAGRPLKKWSGASILGRGQGHLQAIKILGDMDLAAQTAVILNKEGLGEHGLLIIRLFGKRMLGDHITLTGGTHGHPPTYPQGPLRGQLIGPDHLHQVHVHVRWGIHLVGDPFPVGNFDLYVTHTIGVRTGPWTGSRSCSLLVNQWILQQPWRLPSGCRRSLSPPPRWYISSHIFYRDGSVDRHFGT